MEIRLISLANGDCRATRWLTTPTPEIIETNLENFIRRWKNTLNPNDQAKTFKELENLHVHVKKGCLSGIHPGQGTECNERLCGAIAIAVITLMFYAFNCRKEGKKHD